MSLQTIANRSFLYIKNLVAVLPTFQEMAEVRRNSSKTQQLDAPRFGPEIKYWRSTVKPSWRAEEARIRDSPAANRNRCKKNSSSFLSNFGNKLKEDCDRSREEGAAPLYKLRDLAIDRFVREVSSPGNVGSTGWILQLWGVLLQSSRPSSPHISLTRAVSRVTFSLAHVKRETKILYWSCWYPKFIFSITG